MRSTLVAILRAAGALGLCTVFACGSAGEETAEVDASGGDPDAPAAGAADAGAADAPEACEASHVLFLNPAGGSFAYAGVSDSVANTSIFPDPGTPATIPPFARGEVAWADLLGCVRTAFAPFDVAVVDVDPGGVDHVEIVAGGVGTDLAETFDRSIGVMQGGLCDFRPRALGFLFSGNEAPTDLTMCRVAARLAGIAYGLDEILFEEVGCPDPMVARCTSGAPVFMDQAIPYPGGFCNPDEAPTQNSHAELLVTLGPACAE